MSHPTDHVPVWRYGAGDLEGRTWCRVCGYQAIEFECVTCGDFADESIIWHARPDGERHKPVRKEGTA